MTTCPRYKWNPLLTRICTGTTGWSVDYEYFPDNSGITTGFLENSAYRPLDITYLSMGLA